MVDNIAIIKTIDQKLSKYATELYFLVKLKYLYFSFYIKFITLSNL